MGRRREGELRIGTSGYQYDHWRGDFYPAELPESGWFAHYAKRFDTVEINNTFYRLPGAGVFDSWRERAPAGFRYALKFSRYGTHIKHLKDPGEPVRRFVGRARRLGPFLGPVLVQLPPRWRVDPGRLSGFLDAVPADLRWAVEFRDASWLCEEIYSLLREHGAALCIHDMIEDHPRELTARWTYLRFHGNGYGGTYSHQALTAEARRIRGHLDDGVDVYAFFNNDLGGHAVRDAADLRRYATD